MRRKLNYQQRRKLNDKRQHQQEIKDAISTCDECQICCEPLTSKNIAMLDCKHNNYCKQCLFNWCGKSCDDEIAVHPVNYPGSDIMRYPVFFNGCGVFTCPICRKEYSFFYPTSSSSTASSQELGQPRKVIAKVHFSDVFDRNPLVPITNIEQFELFLPCKFKLDALFADPNKFRIKDPRTGDWRSIHPPAVYIKNVINDSLKAGDTDFYMRHVEPNPIYEPGIESDMFITSKSTDTFFTSGRVFDVYEVDQYYEKWA